MPAFYGKCEGGPCDGRPLVHSGHGFTLAYERDRPMRAVPGKVALIDKFDQLFLRIGAYLFHPLTEKWHWFEDSDALPTYDLWIKEHPCDGPATA